MSSGFEDDMDPKFNLMESETREVESIYPELRSKNFLFDIEKNLNIIYVYLVLSFRVRGERGRGWGRW